jgi:hypothetical protein
MAAVESAAKALEAVTVSKTKELKGVSTPPLSREYTVADSGLSRQTKETP